MPTSLSTLDSHIDHIVESRLQTQEARFKPLPAGVERVDDVLRQVILDLADRLAPQGFKPALSKLSLSRRLGEITQTIGLDRDASNLSGVSVQAGVRVSVTSASYGRWCGAEGTGYASKYLWVRQLGYLGGQHAYLRWQLADRESRPTELQHLFDHVAALALPGLEAWSSRQAIRAAVFRYTEQDRIDWLMSAALWAGDKEAAAQLLIRHLQNVPKDRLAYKAELLRFQASVTATPTTPISGAAYLVVRHGLALPVAEPEQV